MITINESGLSFGPYPDEVCFHIEKSATYKNIETGVRIAEFLLLRHRNHDHSEVLVVEAKSSSPKQESVPNFAEYINEIREKLTNGLSLGLASCIRRHASAEGELPNEFKNLNLSRAEFRLVLVINGHEQSWLPDIQNALSKALHATVKTWALGPNAVAVLNHDGARKHGLIN